MIELVITWAVLLVVLVLHLAFAAFLLAGTVTVVRDLAGAGRRR